MFPWVTELSRRFRSLRVRNFRLFFTGQMISQVGNWLTAIALVLLVLHRTHSGVAVGIVTGCQYGPVLIFGAWGGLFADRFNRRRLLLATQTLELCQSATLAILAFSGQPPLVAFYMTALAGGCILAADNPARRAFAADTVPVEDVQNAVSLNSTLMTASRIVGPALAGLLVVTVGFGWCFAADAISYFAVLAALWRIRPDALRQPPVTASGGRRQVGAALRYVRNVPELWVMLVMMSAVGTLSLNLPVVLPLFVEHTLHGGDSGYTLLYSVLSVGSLAGALGTTHRRTVTLRAIVVSSLGVGAAMMLLALSPNLAASFLIAPLVGFAIVFFLTECTALVQIQAEPSLRGRVLALQAIVIVGSTPVGGLLLGVICDALGARAGLAVGALAALGAAGWGYRAILAQPREHSSQLVGSSRREPE
jgi:MFS family permease